MRLAVLAPVVWAGLAHAEPPIPVHTLLADPLQLAAWLHDRDPMIESAHAHVSAAEAARDQTHVLPNPQLDASVSDFVIGKSNPPTPRLTLGQSLIYSVGGSELVELGKRGPRQSAAELRVREAREGEVSTLGGRLSDATATLGKLAFVVSRRAVVATNLDAARKLQGLEKVRLDNNDLSATEFARIELDTEELELQLGRAEAEVASTMASCTALLYGPCDASHLDPTALDAGAPLPAALPEPDGAIAARPARVGTVLETRALGWDATLARNRRIPDVTIGAGFTVDNLTISGDQPHTLGVSVAIPLPVFDRGQHDAAAARATAHALDAEDRAVEHEARGLVDALLAQRTTLTTTLAKLETEAVPKSTQIIQQTRKAFDLGQARLADLLLVERAHRDLLLEVLDTRFDLFGVRAQLRQALGLDDELARGLGRHS